MKRAGMTATLAVTALVFASFLLPGAPAALAAPLAPVQRVVASPAADEAALMAVYSSRVDLQQFFDVSGAGNAVMRQAGLVTLADWARKYGYKEHPDALASYAPLAVPPALRPVAGAVVPKLRAGALFDYNRVTATSVYVVDLASRTPLMAYASVKPHPLASISKLVTSLVVLDSKIPMTKRLSITSADEVGGARLSVARGDTLTVQELMNTTLVASANNAANAFARSTGMSKAEFVAAMNAKAAALGLTHTTLADPTGIEVDNVSNAEEIAALGIEAFARDAIRRATTTSRYPLLLAGGKHNLKNTNELLNDPNNGLYVLGGKTGYLEESRWNLVVKMRDARMKQLVVVVLGSASKAQSFKDAEMVARWTWDNYEWRP